MFKRFIALVVLLAASAPLLWRFPGPPIPNRLYSIDELLIIMQFEPERIIGGVVVGLAWTMWVILAGHTLHLLAAIIATLRDSPDSEDAGQHTPPRR